MMVGTPGVYTHPRSRRARVPTRPRSSRSSSELRSASAGSSHPARARSPTDVTSEPEVGSQFFEAIGIKIEFRLSVFIESREQSSGFGRREFDGGSGFGWRRMAGPKPPARRVAAHMSSHPRPNGWRAGERAVAGQMWARPTDRCAAPRAHTAVTRPQPATRYFEIKLFICSRRNSLMITARDGL